MNFHLSAKGQSTLEAAISITFIISLFATTSLLVGAFALTTWTNFLSRELGYCLLSSQPQKACIERFINKARLAGSLANVQINDLKVNKNQTFIITTINLFNRKIVSKETVEIKGFDL